MKKIKKLIKIYYKEIFFVAFLILVFAASFFTQNTYSGVWTLLNNINIFIGLLTAFLAYKAWRTAESLRNRNTFHMLEEDDSQEGHSVVLTISCGEVSSKLPSNVEHYLEENEDNNSIYKNILHTSYTNLKILDEYYKKIQDNKYHFSIKTHQGIVHISSDGMPVGSDDDIYEYIAEYATALENVIRVFGAMGITNIYIFIGGPVVLGFLAGERLKNNYRVNTFHYNGKNYVEISKASFYEYIKGDKVITLKEEAN